MDSRSVLTPPLPRLGTTSGNRVLVVATEGDGLEATAFPVHGYARATLDIDLIRMKEAAGRPKDLEDLRVLRRLRGDPAPP